MVNTHMTASEFVAKLPFWQNMSSAEQQIIAKTSEIKNFHKDEYIIGTADMYLGFSVIVSGEVRVVLMSEEGRELTLYRLVKDDVCIISAAVIPQITVQTLMIATEDCSLFNIPADVCKKLLSSNKDFRLFLYELSMERMSNAICSLQEIIFSSFEKRLASFLVSYNNTKGKIITMTQAEIAVEVNSSREVVTRMLKKFMEDDLIDVKRGIVEIINVSALEKLASSGN